ncbi:MAG: phage portal protein [Pseudomonadota bacterium]|nr:phage portal protein [Pseudomonadota bacterium]
MVVVMARTLLAYIRNKAPVDLFPSRGVLAATDPGVVSEADLGQMGRVSTVFSIVDGIASEVAAAGWGLYRGESVDDPDRVEVTDHAALVVWEHPNPFFTRAEFVEASQQHFELAGEYWWVVSREGTLPNGRSVRAQWPLELWGVRPDRIAPVPHPRKFIEGYMYRVGRDKVPLALDQVIFNKRQNPLDPYRGLSPLGSLVFDIQGDVQAARYNAVFFKNGADPGGIIEAEGPSLSEQDFQVLMTRWKEQHKGVSNAHRVGYLENAKFVPSTYTRRDMQFVDLRTFSKDTIREAWRFPKSMMGSEAASNRATHEAEKQVFADNIIKPRLRRLRSSLNDDFLSMFPDSDGLFFDFDDPSPDDRESQREDQNANVAAVAALVPLGFDPAETLAAFDLPDLTFDPLTARNPVNPTIPGDPLEPPE